MLRFAFLVFLEAGFQKLELGCPVGTKNQVIVFRVVVEVASDRFHEIHFEKIVYSMDAKCNQNYCGST